MMKRWRQKGGTRLGSGLSVTDPGSGSLSPEEALEAASGVLRGRREIEGWEIYLSRDRSLTIESHEGEVESLTSALMQGMSLRVRSGGRIGFGYTNQMEPREIREALDRSLTAAAYTAEDEFTRFAEPPDDGFARLPLFDPQIEQTPREAKIEAAREIERSALAADGRIRRVRGAEYEEVAGEVWIVNSRGLRAYDRTSLVMASVEAVAEDKSGAQAASELETVHHYDKLNPARVGKSAADKAVMLLGAGTVSKGRRPVVLAPEAAAGLISVLAGAVGADAIDKGRSWLAGLLGERVGSKAVTVVDDALWAEGPGAFPFDDEGVKSRRTTVIREGTLESYLYNSYYGTKAGTGSTGNGMRSSYYLPPGIDSTNWLLLPGTRSERELIGEVRDGLLVLELLGLHTADPVTGEFSLGVSGYRIRDGRVAEAVAGATISGELGELLERVVETADRIKYTGDAGAPAVLVEDMDVCGKD